MPENGAKRHSASPTSETGTAQPVVGAEQARVDARNRAHERMRRVSLDAPASLSLRAGDPARGMRMNCQTLSLADLHDRHVRHARTLNKSEKTITWYGTALTDFCRFLEEVYDVKQPA
ncbi:MAG: hypothetical protein ACRDHE_16275, partial [Ktedonobacterales bacterium]